MVAAVCRAASSCAGAVLRLVDAAGSLSSVGLLQVRTESGFGTVCGVNSKAADVACRQMGFDYGSVSSSSCRHYGGADICGTGGAPVTMKDLHCDGAELDVQSCSWALPDEACRAHDQDAVVFCGTAIASHLLQDGAVRLIGPDGAPSLDGSGRLECFRAGVWASVCGSGFTHGSAGVACRMMGFQGAVASGLSYACRNFRGQDVCGFAPPALSELACGGDESSILSCAFKEGSDVFCAPAESLVLQCSGEGDTQGRPLKVPPPAVGAASFAPSRAVRP